jgi:hypothetical protein|tara:strand:+ start:480 stop:650 length:171 start_codon:yes stop_codon:yes gene_type:complete
MTLESGILLGLIGCTLTITGFIIAFYVGTRKTKKGLKDIAPALRDYYKDEIDKEDK